ncbi:NAD(P)-binding protein [Fusarium mundagurra]|uniref:NAD(P)-binding protein n=1 Tax=Fusarium mundagurra TaxID=1567541 RepID=A0A8H5YQ59_9HYPO|nr:NAD(P)-binding protein [Fusarium mundagurra]
MDLTGKIAIITGCSSGVGLATTELFLSLGAKVFGLDRSPCSLDQPGFKFQACDLARPESIKEAVEVYRATYGSQLDVLANVAGIMDAFASADTVTDEYWERNMSINVTGPTILIREVLPFMKNRGQGSIINVGSKSSTSGGSAGVAYTASKHAIAGVSKNVAWRFRNEGIRCNAVCPGGMVTNIIQNSVSGSFDTEGHKSSQGFIELHIPPGTEPTLNVKHIANTIAFLASDMAGGISGAIIPVDCAWSAA